MSQYQVSRSQPKEGEGQQGEQLRLSVCFQYFPTAKMSPKISMGSNTPTDIREGRAMAMSTTTRIPLPGTAVLAIPIPAPAVSTMAQAQAGRSTR